MPQSKATLISCYRARAVIILLFMTVILSGCGSVKSYMRSWVGPEPPAKKEFITFQIRPAANSNNERPVYLLIRKVNKMEFMTENYDRIAGKALFNQTDESFLASQIVLPGQNEEITIPMPDKSDIGVYVLFADPGDNWKMIFEKPFKSPYRISVTNNNLE